MGAAVNGEGNFVRYITRSDLFSLAKIRPQSVTES